MDPKGLVKLLAIGAAGWWIWSKYGSALGLPSSLLPAGNTPTSTNTSPGTDTGAAQSLIDIRTLMMAKAGLDNSKIPSTLMNVHEWNWFYANVRGSEAPSMAFPSGVDTDSYRMSLDEYLKGTGLAGIQRHTYAKNYLSMPMSIGPSRLR